MNNFTKQCLLFIRQQQFRFTYIFLVAFLLAQLNLNAQTSPLIPAGSVGNTLANAEIPCAAGSDLRIFDFTEDGDSPLAGSPDTYFGEATAVNGVNSLGLSWEYEPTAGGYIVNTSTGVRTNTADNGSSVMTVSFDQEMVNPIIDFTGLQGNSTIALFDCEGNPLSPVLIAETGAHSLSGNTLIQTSGSTGTSASLQFPGSVDCFYYITTAGSGIGPLGEGVTLSIRSCVVEEVLPECASCGPDSSFKYLNLFNRSGTGTGATAEVGLNGTKVGDATVLFSNLTVNEDLAGTAFGAFANGAAIEETLILQIDLCEAITIEQLDVLGLETQSEVWIGTSLSGSGQSAVPTGLTLTQCGGPAHMATTGVNMVTNTNANCRNQGNGNYTVGGTAVNTLFFKYNNPQGGCSFDKATFRVGSCVPDATTVTPECPLTLVRTTTNPDVINGIIPATNSNATYYLRDANGVYINRSTCYPTDAQGLPILPASATVANVSPCAEVIEENLCGGCTPPPPCIECPANSSFDYINLDQQGTNAAGNPEGSVALNNVKIGTYEFLFSDLDVSEDGNGTTFGGWDSDGGTMLLRIDFCEPLLIQELDVRNLEVASEISIGTAASSEDANAVLSGLSLTVCDDASGRMSVGPATNQVITDGPGCIANPNATYTVSGGAVSTLYFKYQNPVGGCTGDYIGFRVGACTPDPVMAIPTCPLNLYTVDDCPDNPTNSTTDYYQDVNGNWFPSSICTDPVDTIPVVVVELSPCASTTFVSECEFCCEFTVECPGSTDLGTFDCTQLANIPLAPTTLAAVSAAPYNVVIGDMPCGDIVVTSSDDGTVEVCTTGGQIITRTVTILDDLNGNGTYDPNDEDLPVTCTFTYTITEDTTPPEVTCTAQNEIHECDGLAGNEAAANAWNAAQIAALTNCSSDICGDILVTSDYAFANLSDDCGFTGTMTVTFKIEDDCGDNFVEQTATFTVIDTTDPFACDPVNETHECNGLAGNEAAANTWNDANMAALTACSNDICGNVVVTNNFDFNLLSDACGLTGDMIVTYTITDDCGNFVLRYASFTIVDTTAPEITCPAAQTLTCFETVPTPVNTPAGFLAIGGTISDICTPNLNDFIVLSQDTDNGGDNCPGNARELVRTYLVIDDCGNITTCEQTFTYLESTTAPVITSVAPSCYKYCAALANPMEEDITYDTDCAFGATVDITGPTQIGQDNCPGSIYRYTYTVTDDCGRTSAPVTRDFIIGNDGPTIECAPFNLFLECGDDNNSDYITQHLNSVNVNTSCELGYTLNYFPQNFNNISCGSATVVTFVATDACGRTASCTTTISVQDNTPPTITAVPPTGLCDVTNCSADVNYWFNHWKDYVVDGMAAEDACDSNVSISASNNPLNTNCPNGDAETVVTFTATDNCGNTTFITGVFTVEASPADLSLFGTIATEDTEPVESVEVSLAGNSLFQSLVTEANGIYQFDGLTGGGNYAVTPLLDEDHLNGVSSFDLVLITKHILHLQSLDSPYKMIAADINNSGSITTMDLVELRKLILHIDDAFAQNTSWRFVEADFAFADPTNPFASTFPEQTFINGLTETEMHDFVGVKIGDVNNSASPNSFAEVEDRNYVGDLVFNIEDRQLAEGETYEVGFRAENFDAIHGYQFSLNFDPSLLAFKDLRAGALDDIDANNFGLTKLDEGVITTSWTNQRVMNISSAKDIFYVSFTARADVMLSEVLSINSRYTAAEAYNENLELMDVKLRYDHPTVYEKGYRLHQNRPNPFYQQTVIGFDLPSDMSATITVYDIAGRELKLIQEDFKKGYNEVLIDIDEVSDLGVLYYKLKTKSFEDVRRMIAVDKR